MEGSKRVGCNPWIRNFIDVKLFEIVLMFGVSTITDEIFQILHFVIVPIQQICNYSLYLICICNGSSIIEQIRICILHLI